MVCLNGLEENSYSTLTRTHSQDTKPVRNGTQLIVGLRLKPAFVIDVNGVFL